MLDTEARDLLLKHLEHVRAICRKRFRGNPNRAEDAQSYIVSKLLEERYRRIKGWGKKGEFLPFLMTVVSRLLTDFIRSEEGHRRPPRWVEDKGVLWIEAWRLIVKRHFDHNDAIETLNVTFPDRQRDEIGKIVGAIEHNCAQQEVEVGIDHVAEPLTANPTPLDELDRDQLRYLGAALIEYLKTGDEALISKEYGDIIGGLRPKTDFSEQERHLLYFVFVEELPMKDVARRLQLRGDPYKQCKKLLKHLCEALKELKWWIGDCNRFYVSGRRK
ncbi:MAG: hypothetical protein ABFS45_01540 [Pseudomonadota bacterium]